MQLASVPKLLTCSASEQYVSERGWLHASLKRCPSHPGGGCRFSRHGTYPRVEPPGMEVPRWYCRDAHRTFSLLPDCMSARLTGSLDEAEQVQSDINCLPERSLLGAFGKQHDDYDHDVFNSAGSTLATPHFGPENGVHLSHSGLLP